MVTANFCIYIVTPLKLMFTVCSTNSSYEPFVLQTVYASDKK